MASVQALVGAFIDGAGGWVVGVAFTKGDEVPDKATVGVLAS
jgi:hypothetical protein